MLTYLCHAKLISGISYMRDLGFAPKAVPCQSTAPLAFNFALKLRKVSISTNQNLLVLLIYFQHHIVAKQLSHPSFEQLS